MRYPAIKQQALEHALHLGADEKILDALRALPERTYESPVALSRVCTTG